MQYYTHTVLSHRDEIDMLFISVNTRVVFLLLVLAVAATLLGLGGTVSADPILV